MVQDTDLSEYEKIRLANIKRNADFLSSMGFSVRPDNGTERPKVEKKSSSSGGGVKKPRVPRDSENTGTQIVTRKSRRLKQQEALEYLSDSYSDNEFDDGDDNVTKKRRKSANDALEKPVDKIVTIDYETFPHDSEFLDDFEFMNYAFLRAWRLGRCKELELEPYKICQNRTLCELIRRRRCTPTWGKDDKNDIQKIADDLLECWGIGPSKAKSDGFGFEILEQLDNLEVVENFEKSRKLENHVKGGDIKLEVKGEGKGEGIGEEKEVGEEGHGVTMMKENSSTEGVTEEEGAESEEADVKKEVKKIEE